MGWFDSKDKKRDDAEYEHDENWMYGMASAACWKCGKTRTKLHYAKQGAAKSAPLVQVCWRCKEDLDSKYGKV